MNPSTASAFDLPDHLAHKAIPALIAADERHFAAIAAEPRRDDRRPHRPARGRAPTRPAGTGQAALDRDLEVHRLTARLRALSRFGLDLCLGQVVAEADGEPLYVGRLGLTDADGRRLLVDWRSPAAEPFFGATHANPMGLVSRRRYRWTHGRVRDYWDEVFTAEGLDEPRGALDDQSAFIASLGSSRSSRMRDVLGTIAADQDAIIRAGSRGPSSSTAGRAPARPSSPCTAPRTSCTPTRASATAGAGCSSSARTSPTSPTSRTCCRASVRRACRPAPCATSCPRGRRRSRRPTARSPGSRPTRGWRRRSSRRSACTRRRPPTTLEVTTPWGDVRLSARRLGRGVRRPRARDAPQRGPRPGVGGAARHPRRPRRRPGGPATAGRTPATSGATTGRPARTSSTPTAYDRGPAGVYRRALATTPSSSTPSPAPGRCSRRRDLVGDLWTVPAYLRRCAPWLTRDEVAALQRRDPTAWTTSDLPLLDAMRHAAR